MRKALSLFVTVSMLAGGAAAWVGLAPAVSAHPTTHQISIADKSAAEGTGAQQSPTMGTMAVSVSPTPQTGETIVVGWQAQQMGVGAGLATGGSVPNHPTDFQTISGQVTFTAGETTENITIPITADHANEPDETFQVTLQSPPACSDCTIVDASGIYTIQNDDAAETLSINDVTMTEGNAIPGTKVFEFTVTRSPGSTKTVTVQASTANGTATAGSDYVQKTQTLTFAVSHAASTQPFQVTVNGDGTPEANETFFVNLTNATNATIADGQGIGTIQNDDAVDPLMSISDATVAEGGNLVFTVTLDEAPPIGQTAQVEFDTVDGTAVAANPDDDYESASNTLTFQSGQTTQQISVTTNEDTDDEPDETMTVDLDKPDPYTAPHDYSFLDEEGTGTITNDDDPALSIDDVSIEEGDVGEDVTATFTVSRNPSNGSSSVDFATSDNSPASGAATVGQDYVFASGTLNFGNGEASKEIDVTILGDVLNEPHENFFVNLSNPINAVISDGQGIGTIIDNEQGHDFNGDGFDDAAFGVPGEDIAGVANAGAVNVLYGSTNPGLTAGPTPQDQRWHLDLADVDGDPSANARYGAALAVGDLDNDGYDDLAVGIPGAANAAGAVSVLYGSASGLSASGNQLLMQGSDGVEGEAEDGDGGGAALAIGDFDGDLIGDLAFGAPGESANGDAGAGAVNVLYGTESGLSTSDDQVFDQDTGTMPDEVEAGDSFANALAAGDLDGDGRDELIVGVVREDITATDDGALTVIPGSAAGLTTTGSQLWHQDVTDVEGDGSEAGDQYATSLSAGDFDGDGFDDVAAGVPLEDVDTDADAGGVNVLYGSGGGLVVADDQFWTQDSGVVRDATQPGDNFGGALVAADINDDGRDDLAIGVPREDYGGSKFNAGRANVLFGSDPDGLVDAGNQLWDADQPDVRGAGESGDVFAGSLGSGDFDGDGFVDVVFGTAGEDVGSIKNAGSAHVLYGASAGLGAGGNQVWHQNVTGVQGKAAKSDVFSQALG